MEGIGCRARFLHPNMEDESVIGISSCCWRRENVCCPAVYSNRAVHLENKKSTSPPTGKSIDLSLSFLPPYPRNVRQKITSRPRGSTRVTTAVSIPPYDDALPLLLADVVYSLPYPPPPSCSSSLSSRLSLPLFSTATTGVAGAGSRPGQASSSSCVQFQSPPFLTASPPPGLPSATSRSTGASFFGKKARHALPALLLLQGTGGLAVTPLGRPRSR